MTPYLLATVNSTLLEEPREAPHTYVRVCHISRRCGAALRQCMHAHTSKHPFIGDIPACVCVCHITHHTKHSLLNTFITSYTSANISQKHKYRAHYLHVLNVFFFISCLTVQLVEDLVEDTRKSARMKVYFADKMERNVYFLLF